MQATYRWRRWEHWLLWVFVALLLAASVVLIVVGIGELGKDQRLDEVGVEVPAEVVRADVDDSGDSTTTTLHVRYVQRGDARIDTTVEITYRGDYLADHPGRSGRQVRIEYDPEEPSVARLVGDDDELGIELLIGAGVCLVLGLAGAVWGVHVWRHRDLTPEARDLEGSAP